MKKRNNWKHKIYRTISIYGEKIEMLLGGAGLFCMIIALYIFLCAF